ncbi:MAG: NUDIX hydrolase [Clostridia bacterium]
MTRSSLPPSPDAVPFAGRAFRVRLVRRNDRGGEAHDFEVVERVPAVAIVAEVNAKLVVVRQERPAVGRILDELPAGKVDPGETPEQAACRELSEETGYVAQTLMHLLDIYPSPGYTSEVVSFFWAPDPLPGPPHPDAGEEMEVILLTASQVRTLLSDQAAAPLNGLLHTGASWWLRRDEGTSA